MSFHPPTDRQARVIWAGATMLAISLIVVVIAAAFWGVGRALDILSPVLWPLAVAGVLAYLLDPVVDWFERRGLTRPRAILFVFAFALLIIVALAASIVPQLITESRDLAARVPAYSERVEEKVQEWIDHPPKFLQRIMKRDVLVPVQVITTNASPENVAATNAPAGTNAVAATPDNPPLQKQSLQTAATTWVAKSLPKAGSWLFGQLTKVGSWFGILAGIVLVPVYLFYLLLEKEGIRSNWTDYLPITHKGVKAEVVFVLNAINDHLITFFRGQVLVAISDGILYTIGFLVIGLPYAVLIGVMSIALTIVPFLGAIVTCVLALIIAVAQYGDWQHPALVLAVFAVVQTIEGLVISPRIMGERTGLHPLTIIVAVMAGTTLLGGLLGGILAIPLTAAGKVLMYRYVWKKRGKSEHHA